MLMPQPQSAILPEANPFALFVVMNVHDQTEQVLRQCQSLQQVIDNLNAEQLGANLTITVAFGKTFWQTLSHPICAKFHDFPQLGSDEIQALSTGGDILIHLRSNRLDLNHYVFSQFLTSISESVEVLEEVQGFRYLDSRDMTGFIDGTENPDTAEDRHKVAVIADGEWAGGSFIMTQRFIHNLPAWHRLNLKAQENVIGRTKLDSIELEDVPEASHVGRVDIKEEGKGLKILRHSLPYGQVSGEHGLFFMACCSQLHNFDVMLNSMYGETDGKTDQLLRFTKAVSGAYFFAPSQSLLMSL